MDTSKIVCAIQNTILYENSARQSRNMFRLQKHGGKPYASNTLLESLESRMHLSAAPLGEIRVSPHLDAQPAAVTMDFLGTTPDQIKHAYGIDQIHFTDTNGNDIVGDGTGQTIAIVSAYFNPTIESDLRTFDAQFGLPDNDGAGNFALTHVSFTHSRGDTIWALESALDVQWAHAVAPGAHILLVEARSANLNDMFVAVNYAKNQPGVVAVSMSWGTDEFYGEWNYDSYFTSPRYQGRSKQAAGVTFIAASGDDGAPGGYPAMAPEVLSVGGTNLNLDDSGKYFSETGWGSSGGGASYFLAQPAYQSNATLSFSRTNPDVSYAADPTNGFPVFCSSYQSGGWINVGGTSAGAPQWAGIIAIADQGRDVANLAPLDGATQTLPAIYNMAASNFNDITTGYNGFKATKDYDLVTGRGTPKANLIAVDLIDVTDQIRPQQLAIRLRAITKVLPWYRRPAGAKLVTLDDSSTSNSDNASNTNNPVNLDDLSQSDQAGQLELVNVSDASEATLSGAIAAKFAAASDTQANASAVKTNSLDELLHRTFKHDLQLSTIDEASAAGMPSII